MNSNQITALHATTSGISIETNSSITLANFSLSDCKLAKQISTSPFIQTLRLLQIVSSVSGLVLSTLFIYTLKSKNANHLHINVRLSLISLTVGAIFACSQVLILAGYGLFVTLIWNSNSDNVDDEWTDACSFMIESYHCGLVRSPILFAIYATILGSIVLAAERTIATIHFQTYELHGSVFVGISLVILQWLVALAITVAVTYNRVLPGYIRYCSIYVAKPRSALFSVTSICIIELITLLLSLVLLRVNQRKRITQFINHSLHSLSERYQLQENIRMMHILVPTMAALAITSGLSLVALLMFAFLDNTFDGEAIHSSAPFSELIILFTTVYGSMFPLLAVAKNSQLRQIARRSFAKLVNENDTNRKRHRYESSSNSVRLKYNESEPHNQVMIGQEERFVFSGQCRESRSQSDDYSKPMSTIVQKRISLQQQYDTEKESHQHFTLLTQMWKK